MTSIQSTFRKNQWFFISWIVLAVLVTFFHIDQKKSMRQIQDQINVLKPRQLKKLLEGIDNRLYQINYNLEYENTGTLDEIKTLLYDIDFMIYEVRDEVENLNWNSR